MKNVAMSNIFHFEEEKKKSRLPLSKLSEPRLNGGSRDFSARGNTITMTANIYSRASEGYSSEEYPERRRGKGKIVFEPQFFR